MDMLSKYNEEVSARKALGIPPVPLSEDQVKEVTEFLAKDADGKAQESATLVDLLANRVEPGVAKAAKVKAEWLEKVANGSVATKNVSPEAAIAMLGSMGGGYNVAALIRLLEKDAVAAKAAEALKPLVKIYEAFDKVVELSGKNAHAKSVLESWAKAEWFTKAPELPARMEFEVYKVDGEINTDDFSPGNQAQSRADIPLHATFFGQKRFPGGVEQLGKIRAAGNRVAFAGDVVGTGSSRKSACNSLAWHIGDDIPGSPNKRRGGLVVAGIFAPIFYATSRDSGVMPLQCDVTAIKSGDKISLDLATMKLSKADGTQIDTKTPPATLKDEYRAGGRLNLVIGKDLTKKACAALKVAEPNCFIHAESPQPKAGQKFTLGQKMLGKACGIPGVVPGQLCEPRMTTVISQDTTGPMTVQELEELACLRFKTGLYMQSYCHTAAYPKKIDLKRWKIMREATESRGGIALKPGDGVCHSWINKTLIPDTVGTGGDSHTRFPKGISFPAGSGLVAFAAALGFMPLEVPESVLVRFKGKRNPGITVRDMVNAIPYYAIKKGLLTVPKKNKINVFAGTILEIEGLDDLRVEEAFELSDATAERSAAACVVTLPLESVVKNVEASIQDLQILLDEGYQDAETLKRRIGELKDWLKKPELLRADEGAEYKTVIEIDLADIKEPILACPNDPDDVKLLSEVAGTKIDEIFVGSCMTHLSHYQNIAKIFAGESYAKGRIWVSPSTRLEAEVLKNEGALGAFSAVGTRMEVPGCSLCMGNQARVAPGTTVVTTSTRNFDNRMGDDAQVFMASSELAAISGMLGKLPTMSEYMELFKKISA